MIRVSPSSSTSTPMARKASRVARASSPRRKPVTLVMPQAMEPNMMERCDIDLSPGTRISPRIPRAGLTV